MRIFIPILFIFLLNKNIRMNQVCEEKSNLITKSINGLHIGSGHFSEGKGNDFVFFNKINQIIQILFFSEKQGKYTDSLIIKIGCSEVLNFLFYDFTSNGYSDILFFCKESKTFSLITFKKEKNYSLLNIKFKDFETSTKINKLLNNLNGLYLISNPLNNQPTIILSYKENKENKESNLILQETFLSFQENSSIAIMEVKQIPFLTISYKQFPDSLEDLMQYDMDKDCLTDLILIGKENILVFWSENFKSSNNINSKLYNFSSFEIENEKEIRKILIRDVTRDGFVDFILAYRNGFILLEGVSENMIINNKKEIKIECQRDIPIEPKFLPTSKIKKVLFNSLKSNNNNGEEIFELLGKEIRFSDINLEGFLEIMVTIIDKEKLFSEIWLYEFKAEKEIFFKEFVFTSLSTKSKLASNYNKSSSILESIQKEGNYVTELIDIGDLEFPISAVFFDFQHNGLPALLFSGKISSSNKKDLKDFKESFEEEIFDLKEGQSFLSNLILCGAPITGYHIKLNVWKSYLSSNKNSEINKEKNFFTNSLPGGILRYETKDLKGMKIVSQHSTGISSNFRALECPYVFAGIGFDVNILEKYFFGISLKRENGICGDLDLLSENEGNDSKKKKKKFKKVKECFKKEVWGLPNSYYVLVPEPVERPSSWIVYISVKTTKFKIVVFLVVFLGLGILLAIILVLKYFERKEDLRIDGISNALFI